MTIPNKRGRPSKTPEESLVEWHISLNSLLKVVGADWFHQNLKAFNSNSGRTKLKKLVQKHRLEAEESLKVLKNTKPVSAAHKCSIKWVKAQAMQLEAEADAIELLVDAFEHKLPNRAANCLMGVLLDVAVTVKNKFGECGWRHQFLKKLQSIDLGKHVGMGEDGVLVLPVIPDSPTTDFTNLTFDKAIENWVHQHTGAKLSRRTFFRAMKQRGLSDK